MKVDSELLFCQSAQVQKPNSKTFEHNDSTMDTAELKIGTNTMKETENANFNDLKGDKKDEDFLPFEIGDGDGLWSSSEFDRSMNGDDSANALEFKGPCDCSPRRIESWEKDLVFYADKGVLEYELPEVIVYYKESTDHVVKDIWIDEGVPSQAKSFFGSSVDDNKVFHTFLSPIEEHNSELLKDKSDNTISIVDGLNSATVNDFCKDTSDKCSFRELMRMDNTIVDDVSKPKCMPENSESFDNIGIEKNAATDKIMDGVSEQKSSSKYMPSVLELCSMDSHSKSSDNDRNGVDPESIQISSEEAIFAGPTLISSGAEASNNCRVDVVLSPDQVSGDEDELCYNSKTENGSITFNFDNPKSAISGIKESSENEVSGHLGIQSMSKIEDAISEVREISNQDQHNHGESSFSAAGPSSGLISYSGQISGRLSQNGDSARYLEDDMFDSRTILNQLQHGPGESSFSGLITYSGPITYSGSLSVRSDSSTTSTRSFAFPVLQSEWNSSPVRMAKADRRLLRKNRSWRQGLLCCRF